MVYDYEVVENMVDGNGGSNYARFPSGKSDVWVVSLWCDGTNGSSYDEDEILFSSSLSCGVLEVNRSMHYGTANSDISNWWWWYMSSEYPTNGILCVVWVIGTTPFLWQINGNNGGVDATLPFSKSSISALDAINSDFGVRSTSGQWQWKMTWHL